jgi:8-oxo-dGTP diphosphatase
MEEIKRFNVRVYGLLFDADQRILTTIENIKGKTYRKFPGGGLEWGEGTRDCLKREFLEELNLPIEVEEHLYTTDFFVESAFSFSDQVISIYYKVKALQEINLKTLKSSEIELLELDWIHSHKMTEELFNFPIDKQLVKLLF